MPMIFLEKAQELYDSDDLPDGVRILDMAGIAEVLGVQPDTPQQWRYRGLGPASEPFPEPDLSPGGKPLWDIDTIVAWAKATGRWPRGTAHRPQRRPRVLDTAVAGSGGQE